MAPASELYDPSEHLGPRVLSRPLRALPPPHARCVDRLEELLLVRVHGRVGRLGETASEGRIEGIPRYVPCPWGSAPRSRPRTFVGPERWTGPVTISCANGSPRLGS